MISTYSKLTSAFLFLCLILGCQTFSRMLQKGGLMFTAEIETDQPNKDEIIEQTVKVLQSRLNSLGIDGEIAKIPDRPDQISVKLYGNIKDPERVKKFLFTTNQLELKKVAADNFQTFPTKEDAEKLATAEQEVLPYTERDDSNSSSSPQQFVIVEKNAVINGEDIREAKPFSRTGAADDNQIMFSLKKEGAVKLGEWTGKNIGKYLAIVLDKKVISAPVIKGQIFDNGMIEGRFTKGAAQDLALSLSSGYLPATIKLLEEKTFQK